MDRLQAIKREYWGYDEWLPLQKEAMASIINKRDSLVVLPTGGGKSLCFQVPALVQNGMAIVVSPLISLMKDQVDALRECGVSAAFINSSLSTEERRSVLADARKGQLKLLYVAPERLVGDYFIDFIKSIKISFIAVDEAHCVSMWGHDFRPEYHELKILKRVLPDVTIHAYTATATEQVRGDIIKQLGLENPEVLVGSFDRPNLNYAVARRAAGAKRLAQILEVIDRHRDESGIIYCISRKNVDALNKELNQRGYRSLPYHAGMSDADRKASQNAFIREEIDIIVATVAFGMGIDKSNVRYVVHAGLPQSLEHYQQESGRAGRDGLEAECCLFFSLQDYAIWQRILSDNDQQQASILHAKLGAMVNYASSVICRHETLLKYFSQNLDKSNCQACDVCLGRLDLVEDAHVISQKILSCVIRLRERFGGDYTAKVLAGSFDKRILANGHDNLSTYGLLSEHAQGVVHDWIEQLVSQNFLCKSGEYNLLQVTAAGQCVLGKE